MDDQDRLNLLETARLLDLPVKEVVRRAEREELRGVLRRGHWEFRRQDLREYLQQEVPGYDPSALAQFSERLSELYGVADDMIVTPLLHHELIVLPLSGRSKSSALRQLVEAGEAAGLVWNKAELLTAIEEREQMCTTGIGGGVALPHPRHMPAYAVAESFLAVGRTQAPIPYGSVDGSMVDLLFLLCSTDESLHLHLLSRLCLILRQGDTLEALRAAETSDEIYDLLREREQSIPTTK